MREIYQLWRPSPLFRAHRLEAALGTPAKIYYKYEGVSPAGSHKVNTSVAQAYYNAEAGIKRIATETGAGQWGCSMALAGQMFGLEVRVYMVKVSYGQKPYRRSMMQTWGAEVFASPSMETNSGRAALAEDPDNQGSLGLAISEAVEDAASRADTNYALGSVLNHVLLHQTVIGLEAKKQFEKAGDYPGHDLRPLRRRLQLRRRGLPLLRRQGGRQERAPGRGGARLLPDADARPLRLRLRRHRQAHADDADVHPRPRLHAARHPRRRPALPRRLGAGVAALSREADRGGGRAQLATFQAGVTFARAEGIIPAPESNHAIAACIDEALRCKESGEPKTLFFNLSGHGHFDMGAYDSYFSGKLEDFAYPEEAIKAALERLPKVG